MKLLALDTATEACSAALLVGEELRARYRVAPREHSRLILPMCNELLSEAGMRVGDLDAVAFGRGPGSFTGVRIAAGVVQGMAFGAALPVLPVSTLAAMAQAAMSGRGEGRVLAAIDARMQEVYWGAYERDAGGLARPVGDETVLPPGRVPLPPGQGWFGTGSGWAAWGEVLAERLAGRVHGHEGGSFPDARHMIPLALADWEAGRAVAAELAYPVYLRDRVARKRPVGRKF